MRFALFSIIFLLTLSFVTAVPAGYLDSAGIYTVTTDGIDDTGKLPFSISFPPRPDRIYYENIYYTTSTDTWEPKTLSGGGGGWITSGSLDVIIPQDQVDAAEVYVVAFYCDDLDPDPDKTDWRCGCDDGGCNKWAAYSLLESETSCAPGTSIVCYTGAAATKNVGPCKEGVKYCNAAGDGYDACIGEVLPATEICSGGVDEDCDDAVDDDDTDCGAVCTPAAEICDDGTDNDCDDDTDCDDADCAADAACDAGAQITGDLSLTDEALVYDSKFVGDCTQAKTGGYGPAFFSHAIDPENKILYLNDHGGMGRLSLNKLQTTSYQGLDYYYLPTQTCAGGGSDWPFSAALPCIKHQGDGAGCHNAFTTPPGFVSEHVLSIHTYSNAASNTEIVFSDETGTIKLDTQFIPPRDLGAFQHCNGDPTSLVRPDGSGYFVGGIEGLSADFAFLFAPGSKRYALLAPEGYCGGGSGQGTIEEAYLVDITNPANPTSLGLLSQFSELDTAIKAIVHEPYMGSVYYKQILRPGTPGPRMVVAEEGGEQVLYDITDPTNVFERDRWPKDSTMVYTGAVSGHLGKRGAIFDGNTLYAYFGTRITPDSPNGLDDLNPESHSHCWADYSCKFGQLWAHELGTDTWEKVLDVPARKGAIFDGKLFLFDYIYDVENTYDGSGYHTGEHFPPSMSLWVFDLETKEWLVKEQVDAPVEGSAATCLDGHHGHWNNIAITEQDGKYYVYYPFIGCFVPGDAELPHTGMYGYELTPS